MSNCACGSGESFETCCARFIHQGQRAETAEQLMRARYTAHTTGDMPFIFRTHHPATRAEIDESSTTRWATESEWLGLEIRRVDGGGPDDQEGRVEFVARFRDPKGDRHDHAEIAIFERHNRDWYFKDAEVPKVRQFRRDSPKQGRNDPCACGSGKKYKKCCGAAA